jgi:hypothetical protein
MRFITYCLVFSDAWIPQIGQCPFHFSERTFYSPVVFRPLILWLSETHNLHDIVMIVNLQQEKQSVLPPAFPFLLTHLLSIHPQEFITMTLYA